MEARIYMNIETLLRNPVPIPDPIHQEEEAQAFYSRYYQSETDDSPIQARTSLSNRLFAVSSNFGQYHRVLDLGSGRGILETEYVQRFGTPPFRFVTVDIADFSKNQLFHNFPHVQASGALLPFRNNEFDTIICNMAGDFMPAKTYEEIYRIAKPGSKVLFNFHHPKAIIPPDLDEKIIRLEAKIRIKHKIGKMPSQRDELQLAVLRHKLYLRDNDILFESQQKIRHTFLNCGFIIQQIAIAEVKLDKWWEVDLLRKNG